MSDTFFSPLGSGSSSGGSLPYIPNPATSPLSVTALGGITLPIGFPVIAMWVVGNGGPITVTAMPSLGSVLSAGTIVYLFGTSNTDTVTLQTNTDLAGSGLLINGPVILDALQGIALMSDGTDYREIGRVK